MWNYVQMDPWGIWASLVPTDRVTATVETALAESRWPTLMIGERIYNCILTTLVFIIDVFSLHLHLFPDRNSNNNNTSESNNNDDNDDAGASYGEDEYSNTFSPKHSSKSNYGSSSHRNAYSSETAGAERGASTSTRQYNVPSEAILRFRKEWIDKAEGLVLEPTMVNGKLSYISFFTALCAVGSFMSLQHSCADEVESRSWGS